MLLEPPQLKHSDAVYPEALQLHAELPAGEMESAGQSVHAVEPAIVEYVPAAQLVHAVLPAEVAYLAAGQGIQSSFPTVKSNGPTI